MKNVTVSLDEDTYRRARLRAAEMDVSLSGLVRGFLNGLGTEDTESDRLKREEQSLYDQFAAGSGADRLPREALYERVYKTGEA